MTGKTQLYMYKGFRLRIEVGDGTILGLVDVPAGPWPGRARPTSEWPTVHGPDVATVYDKLVELVETHYRSVVVAPADAG